MPDSLYKRTLGKQELAIVHAFEHMFIENPPLTSISSFNVEHWSQIAIKPCSTWHIH